MYIIVYMDPGKPYTTKIWIMKMAKEKSFIKTLQKTDERYTEGKEWKFVSHKQNEKVKELFV